MKELSKKDSESSTYWNKWYFWLVLFLLAQIVFFSWFTSFFK